MKILRPILCVSFPRAGSRYLRALIQQTLGADFRPVDAHECDPAALSGANWIKHHDFDLDLQTTPDWSIVVQIRHPLSSIASRWELETRNSQTIRDSVSEWQTWSLGQARYYARFVRKWVVGSMADLIIPQHRLNLQPHLYARLVGSMMTGERVWISRDEVPSPTVPSRQQDFRHYDREWFFILWNACATEAQMLGYEFDQ